MTSKSYAAIEVEKFETHNTVTEMRVEYTGETLNASEVRTGAGQYMTQSEIEAFTEEVYKVRRDKAEAENKAAWDRAEKEKHEDDSSYVPKEYTGTKIYENVILVVVSKVSS